MNDVVSWKGKNDNETYDEILNDMYKPDFSTVQLSNGENLEKMTVTIFPYGRCVKLLNYPNPLLIKTKQSIQLFLTDAYQDTYFSLALKSFSGESVKIDLSAPEVNNELATYNIQLTLRKNLEYKGYCKNYDSVENYYECLKSAYKSRLDDCVPKWLNKESSCDKKKMLNGTDDIRPFLSNISFHITSGDSLNMAECKPSCLTTRVISKQLVNRKNLGKVNQVYIKYLHKTTYNSDLKYKNISNM